MKLSILSDLYYQFNVISSEIIAINFLLCKMTLNSIWKIKSYEYPGQLQQQQMAVWPYKRMKQYKIRIFKKGSWFKN